jgi:hypothetical protein
MKTFKLLRTLSALLYVALAPAAYADIYKCTDEHGNVAYLQTPCPVEVADEPPVAAEHDDYVPESTPEPRLPEPPVPSSRRAGETLQDCKTRYRDQIDEIDAEMRKGFSPEEGPGFKEKLLVLTKQLRACAANPSGIR